ncbi:ABC transporter substrate-binding protein [Glycomyces algeriensis]|uniref:ABC transporter substrate-binding protein n=1 Tax=Glycomyces algeriensis TaxID=256037 RepID=A0A9W6LIT1_9ACTN|nr:ABC transporter substrate-binding protein [Glycomyces algeriensis]MDA1365579.1 ABC transporter substrate-binding protein [Glycomyces algeriensis]MDR7351267.1 ABC-type branched-subunit amino acid transport system substrate-binding protein [Glycomyces algeriensis]GLI43981.1 ABC transporter substrate-binding protein [Glycomyces algeriensis]
MRTQKPFKSAAALAAAAALGLAACSTPDSDESVPGVTDDTVTIGTHQPLTGPAAAGYATISAATAAYFEYVNANGGINGREIEYLVKDDGYDPSATQSAVRELVTEEKVFAIVNGLGTPTHSAVLDYLDQQSVPDLFVSSGSLTWNQPDVYENTFAFNADYVTEGAALAQYAVDQQPDAKICVLGQDDDYGDGIIEGVETVLGSNAVTDVQVYSTSAEDLTAQMGAMMAAGCEVNVLGTINGFTAMAVGTAAQMEWFPKWYVSSSGADYPTLAGYLGADLAPQLLQGMVSVNYLPFSPDGEWVALFEEINAEYNDGAPFTGNTVFGMSVGYLFAEALAAAGDDPTRESLVAAIESGDLVGNGIVPLSFAEGDHAAYRSVGITVVNEGVQDYVGTTYEVGAGSVSAVEPNPVPLANEGIPGS